ncbi:MAG: pyridoxamine 5-phosphate oxidase [Burkholderiaceae bacterium]
MTMMQSLDSSPGAASPGSTVADVDTLEANLGKPSFRVGLKVIDHIDDGAAHWIAVSPLAFLAFCDDGSARRAPVAAPTAVSMTLAGGAPGFASRQDRKSLRVPLDAIDDPALARVGVAVGSLFLAPDVGETLRINGRVRAVDAQALLVDVDECYVHCAKALIRSAFWKAAPSRVDAPTLAAFAPLTPFMALASFDPGNGADVSPKGDPAGSMIRVGGRGLTYAERPGNRRADSFRNILVQPSVAAIALIPGSDQIAVVAGEASISNDEARRAEWVVAGKTPLLTTSIALREAAVRRSDALARADLWPVKPPADAPDPARLLVQHITSHEHRSAEFQELREALAVPGTMEKGLAESYRNNLY